MENIVYYFLIVFGAILVWISCNDLRKLKENNAQWAEIEQQSHLYKQDNYEEAEKLVKKLQKIIPFLAKFSLLNGVFAIVGSLLGLVGLFNNINLNLYYVGYISIIVLFLSVMGIFSLAFGMIKTNSTGIAIFIRFNNRYKLALEYIVSNSIYDLQVFFEEYVDDNYKIIQIPGTSIIGEADYIECVILKFIFLLFFNISVLLICLSFFFNPEFHHMIMKF
ncbi:MAG: hypothetical protein J6M43_06975 [Neisseriaceae bacterium]|nr:hypothetical protein [Neisseriaceae bacterium]